MSDIEVEEQHIKDEEHIKEEFEQSTTPVEEASVIDGGKKEERIEGGNETVERKTFRCVLGITVPIVWVLGFAFMIYKFVPIEFGFTALWRHYGNDCCKNISDILTCSIDATCYSRLGEILKAANRTLSQAHDECCFYMAGPNTWPFLLPLTALKQCSHQCIRRLADLP